MKDSSEERTHGATVELKELSLLEILDDVQEILTKMVTPGMLASSNEEIWHEQTRTALSLVLRAISILKKQEEHKGQAQ